MRTPPRAPLSRIELRTAIAAPAAACFDASRDIDVHLESMASSQERAVAGVTHGLIGHGEEVSWRARHFGITWKMTSKIVAYERPAMFVDEMQSGPFASFRHEHLFEEEGGVTSMVDVVTYRAPLGILGCVVDRVVLRRYLVALLEERNHHVREAAESAAG